MSMLCCFYKTNFTYFLVCFARYKTRPGLTYHYNHSHKEKDIEGYQLPESDDLEARSLDSPSAGSDSLDGPLQARGGNSFQQHPTFANLGVPLEEDLRSRHDRSPGQMKGLVRGVSPTPTHARPFSQGSSSFSYDDTAWSVSRYQ